MNKVHAHEVLRMMEGHSYTRESLREAIVELFGEQTLFHTCSAEGLNSEELILFLEAKGKFKPTVDGFTMDITKVCEDY